MSFHSAPIPSEHAPPDWREIEDLLEEIAQAARSTLSESDFYRMVLDRIVPAVRIRGACLWTARRPHELRLECELNLEESATVDPTGWRVPLVEEVLASGEPRVVPPGNFGVSGKSSGLPSVCTHIFQPFPSGLRTPGLIEFVCRGNVAAAEVHGYLRILAALGELIGDHDHNRELSELRGNERVWQQGELFALRVHASLDLNRTAYLIANEGRRLLECDRVSVVMRRGASFRALAISGVDVLDRRAQLVRRLERLASKVAGSGDSVWYCDGLADFPAEIEQPLQEYLDESHCRVLAIVPLVERHDEDVHAKGEPFGVLFIERFQTSIVDARLRSRTSAMAGQASLALANARTHSQLPLSSLGRGLAKARWLADARQLPRTLMAIAAAALIVTGLAFIPADFNIEARGELQPQRRRDVFASDDGVVSELLVDHGHATRKGEALVVLRKPQLDLEYSRVVGEIQTAEKRLAAVQSERLTNVPAAPETRRNSHQLTADEEELKKLLEGLRDQRALLERQRNELTIRSPLDGQALTWNLQELLQARPVQRGQTLLTVADLNGPWELELHLPDYRAGHVLAARAEAGDELGVTFALASEPGTEYRGTITNVGLSTELDDKSVPTVLATVQFDRDKVAGLRPGATAIAQIHCGRRSIGYVWLHDLFEAVQSHWWW